VGGVGGLGEKWPTPKFWLLHAAFAVGSGTVFVLFKVFLSPFLLNGPSKQGMRR
jgi:proton-dependent oligopeptide transporter, POT family